MVTLSSFVLFLALHEARGDRSRGRRRQRLGVFGQGSFARPDSGRAPLALAGRDHGVPPGALGEGERGVRSAEKRGGVVVREQLGDSA